MTELLTAAQMRAIEQAAIASGDVTGLELMERAGRGVVEAIFEEWPELKATSHRAVVLCGPGNNGGDGFVVARLLREWGWEVEVFLFGDPEKLPPDARVNYERWRGMGDVAPLEHVAEHRSGQIAAVAPDLWVDAFFGTGLSRPLPDACTAAFSAIHYERNWKSDRLVAIDVLSGMCGDSGRALSLLPMQADLVVTFHRAKLGHHLMEGPRLSGALRVKSLGFRPDWKFDRCLPLRSVVSLGANLGKDAPYSLEKSEFSGPAHKYTHGHALILSGQAGHTGAARLAARGALRIGAGLVSVGCPPEAIAENAARLDAVMLRAVGTGEVGGLMVVLEDSRINALCIGPGLGLDARGCEIVATGLGSGRKAVLDADALTILAQNPGLFASLHENCVLTPHAGEFARLFPDIAEKLAAPATTGPAYSKVDATREASKRAGCVVLYKGPDTVIADPSGRCSINSAHYDRTAPWLATAGSGDVLAGFITGLLARGFAPTVAAETAAWLHVECARSYGPGLIAEDLPGELPKVFRTLGL